MKKNFDYLDAETILAIHCGVIRPILEYAVQSWCPYLIKDIEELEKVQHRVTKLIPGMSDWAKSAVFFRHLIFVNLGVWGAIVQLGWFKKIHQACPELWVKG